ncbi:MAG: arylsulfatase [Acidimicrobiales bacterium]
MADELIQSRPDQPFPGTVGRTLETSTPAWPARSEAPEGAPNVVVIVLDDVGYGQLSPFGGLCETPNLDRLADRGLRFSNFHTTALCSPTRGCLLTGRNHHTLGLSAITEMSLGFPAHNATMGFEHGFISEALVAAGYNTFAVGKWHLTPPAETTPAGPYHRWPLGRGFERYYGFRGGDTDQWHPDLTHDNHSVRQPATPQEGYHLNVDLADHAIEFVKDAHANAPDKPFFLWFATGAGHAPHQVEPEWIERYAGAFDMGWDEYRRIVFERQLAIGLVPAGTELSERDPDVEPWDSLSDDAKRMYTRQMEVYAGFLSQTDHHIGRVLDFIDTIDELDNTIVIAVSDNGASAEGGEHGTRNEGLFFNLAPERLEDNLAVIDAWGSEDTFNHYSWGWTWAGDTPFRRWKRETYRGGVTDPCIVSWPAGISARGEVRTQFAHAIDVMPTLLEVIGIDAPAAIRGVEQSPLHGTSLAYAFDAPDAPSRHTTQYFEMFAHRSIVHDGWKAVCPYPGPSLAEGVERGHPFGTFVTEAILDRLDAEDWELYHLEADPAECHDVAAEHPDRLAELRELWWSEAERYGALPIAGSGIDRLFARRPRVGGARQVYELFPDGSPVSFAASPRVNNRPHSITAHVTVPEGGAEGVLLTHGNRHGGYAFFVADGRLHYVHNYLSLQRFTVSATQPVPTGHAQLRMELAPTGPADFASGKGTPAEVRLFVDDEVVGFGELPYSVPNLFATVGMSCGYAAFDSVDPSAYLAPFTFTGTIHKVVLDVTGRLIVDPTAEMTRLMTQQ